MPRHKATEGKNSAITFESRIECIFCVLSSFELVFWLLLLLLVHNHLPLSSQRVSPSNSPNTNIYSHLFLSSQHSTFAPVPKTIAFAQPKFRLWTVCFDFYLETCSIEIEVNTEKLRNTIHSHHLGLTLYIKLLIAVMDFFLLLLSSISLMICGI